MSEDLQSAYTEINRLSKLYRQSEAKYEALKSQVARHRRAAVSEYITGSPDDEIPDWDVALWSYIDPPPPSSLYHVERSKDG